MKVAGEGHISKIGKAIYGTSQTQAYIWNRECSIKVLYNAMLTFLTGPVTEGIYLIIHSCGKYAPWCHFNSLCINVLQMERTSKPTDDQNMNLQNEQMQRGSNISLNAVLFQIKLVLILARELKSWFISWQSSKYEKARNSNNLKLCLLQCSISGSTKTKPMQKFYLDVKHTGRSIEWSLYLR